nr:hypothetical protein [uncultured Herbaspirillum sp.]
MVLQDVEQVVLAALRVAQRSNQLLAPVRPLLPPALGGSFDVSNDTDNPFLGEDLVEDGIGHEFVHFSGVDALLVLAEACLRLAAAVVVVAGAISTGTALGVHGATAHVALEKTDQEVMAARRPAGNLRGAILDAVLHRFEKLLVNDRLVALFAGPCLLGLQHTVLVAAENRESGVDPVLQHEVDAGTAPALSALEAADAIQLVRDGGGPDALQAHLEHIPHHCCFPLVDHQALPLALGLSLVAEGHIAAVEEAILRILDHAALGVLRDAAAGIFVHHLQQGFHEPALIGG